MYCHGRHAPAVLLFLSSRSTASLSFGTNTSRKVEYTCTQLSSQHSAFQWWPTVQAGHSPFDRSTLHLSWSDPRQKKHRMGP